MTWHDIGSAPVDGREILAAFQLGPGWVYQIVNSFQWEFEFEGSGISRDIAPFTHWAKLEPPQVTL